MENDEERENRAAAAESRRKLLLEIGGSFLAMGLESEKVILERLEAIAKAASQARQIIEADQPQIARPKR
jgi:hypothetical protein